MSTAVLLSYLARCQPLARRVHCCFTVLVSPVSARRVHCCFTVLFSPVSARHVHCCFTVLVSPVSARLVHCCFTVLVSPVSARRVHCCFTVLVSSVPARLVHCCVLLHVRVCQAIKSGPIPKDTSVNWIKPLAVWRVRETRCSRLDHQGVLQLR